MIRYGEEGDFEILKKYDRHISDEQLKNSLEKRRVIIAEEKSGFIGWLRYNLFWDNTPFMNMLFILEKYRSRGYGRLLTEFWEKEQAKQGYAKVMTSTLSNEDGQLFFRKNGYSDCGVLLLPGEAAEIIMMKNIGGLDI